MIEKMTKKQYWARVEELENKYFVLRRQLFPVWLREVDKQTRELGLKNYAERNKLPVYQKGQGLKTAFEIMRYAPSYKVAVERLNHQVAEPSCPEYFRQAVQLVLSDLQAEKVESMTASFFIAEEAATK